MTLEQAIEHAEEIARSCESLISNYASDRICAEERRQLAAWLRELQERRKQPEIIRCGECDYFNTGSTWCRWWARYVPKNGYCHQAAERRNDETD